MRTATSGPAPVFSAASPGNASPSQVTEIKQKKTLTKKEIKKMTKEIKAKIKSGAELDEDEEAFAEEHELWK